MTDAVRSTIYYASIRRRQRAIATQEPFKENTRPKHRNDGVKCFNFCRVVPKTNYYTGSNLREMTLFVQYNVWNGYTLETPNKNTRVHKTDELTK